ncbi:MAG: helix-turn-helix domain-containing protein [Rhodospirillaceae bacterium]
MKSTRTAKYQVLLRQLRAARSTAGVTQLELAKRLGKAQSYVSKTESGERRLDVIEYLEWMLALGGDPVSTLNKLRSDLPARRLKIRGRP